MVILLATRSHARGLLEQEAPGPAQYLPSLLLTLPTSVVNNNQELVDQVNPVQCQVQEQGEDKVEEDREEPLLYHLHSTPG